MSAYIPALEGNHKPIDRYTAAHFGVGMLLCFSKVPFSWAAVGAVAFEMAEDKIKRANPSVFPVPTPDTKANALWDVMALMVGWGVGDLVERAWE